MRIETIVEGDLPFLREFQPEGWSDIVPAFDTYVRTPFCRPVKATIEQRIAGVGAAICFHSTGWLAHIIVHPELRNRGIGTAIVDWLVCHLRESGCETMLLIATDLGYPIYRKAGFVEQTEYVFFEREKPLGEFRHTEHTGRFQSTELSDVLVLDRRVSGEDRRTLLLPQLESCLVCRRDGKVAGYYMPLLGEGLVVADHEEAGQELMRLRCSASRTATLPRENSAGICFLRETGFLETRRAKRMSLGKELAWNPEKIYARIGGNLG